MYFKELNIMKKDTSSIIEVEGKKITVKKIIPSDDVIKIITATLNKSRDSKGVYNDLLLYAYLHLHILYKHTDIEFSDADKADELALYDTIKYNSDLFEKVIEVIGRPHFNYYQDLIDSQIQREKEARYWKNDILEIIEGLGKNASIAAEQLKDFDVNKFQEALSFAKALNGDRPIHPVQTK